MYVLVLEKYYFSVIFWPTRTAGLAFLQTPPLVLVNETWTLAQQQQKQQKQ